jgi:16S rRNA (uracil1498-N3)-methyltransferase
LDGTEAHHLLHVMRAAVGQHVTLFDGSGAEFSAVVESLGRSSAILQIFERREVNRELPFLLTIGVALPKGDRQKWLVEKITELGATAIVPLTTERGVAQPVAGALERLRRSVIESSKQCGRNRLMRIEEPKRWREWIRQSQESGECRRLLAHPGGQPLAQFDLTRPQTTFLAIGPEGGLSDAEVADTMQAGWEVVGLGPRILRTETAAVSLAAAVALASVA